MIKSALIRLALGILWMLQWLPLPILARLGSGLGHLLYRVAGSRRRIALRNLELCFPQMPLAERQAIVREHFGWLLRSLFERAMFWYGPAWRLKRLIQVEGDIDLAEREFHATGRSTMWLCPHFVGLDVAGAAILLCQPRPGASIYQTQSNAVIDAAMKRGRLRFGDAEIFPRQDSVKPLLRAIKAGRGFFNLPDMDFGLQDAAFVPFFGVPAATLLAPSRMAKMLNMVVQPVIAELLPGGQGYKVHFLPALENFPTADAVADTARLNTFIEDQIRLRLPQYLWVHKRFKTRPPGEPGVY
ncbi:lipid A biosynthesis acyltransferase [Aquabacterium soli]|uniref:Lipid A biosynthesis acyltransferase n=1 Tax=Aquabacterium soli TaxID=2493092 RepID=A0A426V9P0_9BURK|nr:lipid A biosynthesis acyltransferase [Aquabacterium soli]RRS03656.1 lipid A biosynthesis acyltransferase [Aquabacterium soli]